MIQLVKLFLVRPAQSIRLACLSQLLTASLVNISLHVILIQFTDPPTITQSYQFIYLHVLLAVVTNYSVV